MLKQMAGGSKWYDAPSVSLSSLNTNAVLKDGSKAFTAAQSMGGNKLTNLAAPTSGSDASTKTYVDEQIAAATALKNVVYVSEAGSDSTGRGSIAAPFASLQKAHDWAVANVAATTHVVVMVAPGNSYSGALNVTRQRTHFVAMGASLPSQKPVNLGNAAININCSTATGQVLNDTVSFTGFVITTAINTTAPAVYITGTGLFSTYLIGCNIISNSVNAAAHAVSCDAVPSGSTLPRIELRGCNTNVTSGSSAALSIQGYRGNWYVTDCDISSLSINNSLMSFSNNATCVVSRSLLEGVANAPVVVVSGTNVYPAIKFAMDDSTISNSNASGASAHGINLATTGMFAMFTSPVFNILNNGAAVYAVTGASGALAAVGNDQYALNQKWSANVTKSFLNPTFTIAQGGTGATTKAAAFNALSPLAAKGDLVGFNGSANVSVAVGSNGQLLVADSASASGFKWSTTSLSLLSDLTISAAADAQVLQFDAASGKWVNGKPKINVDGSVAFSGNQSMGNNKLTNLAAPTANADAATKKYVDDGDAATLVSAKSYADSQDAVNLAAAKSYSDNGDAATLVSAKAYADAQDAITLTSANLYADNGLALKLNKAGDTMTGNLTMSNGAVIDAGSEKIVNVKAPTEDTDAANKAYVDAAVHGMALKAPAHVLFAGASLTLSGLPVIDGHQVENGNRVLVVDSADAIVNGIYVASAGSWSRAADMAIGSDGASAFVFIEQGTTYGETSWVCTADDPNAVVGTNALPFVQMYGAGAYKAGAGLQLDGTTFKISDGGVTNAMLAGSITQDKLNLSSPVAGKDAVTLSFLNDQLALKLDLAGGAMLGNIDMGGNEVTGLPATPGSLYAAASKAYVDAQDTLKLGDAEAYADAVGAQALLDAKAYADAQDVINLASAESYADGVGAAALADAKSYADAGLALKLDLAGGVMSGQIDMGGSAIVGLPLTEPVNDGDAASKLYVDSGDAAGRGYANSLVVSMGNSLHSQIVSSAASTLADANAYTDTSSASTLASANTYADGVSAQALLDAKAYADAQDVINLASAESYADGVASTALADAKSYADAGLALKLDLAGGTMSGAIAMGGNGITGLADPVNAQDAATKAWVLANASARAPKVYADVLSAVSANSDAFGGSGGNLSATLPDMSAGTFVEDYDVFLNGMLLRPGLNSGTDNDYYPGSSGRKLKFEFDLAQADVLCVVAFTA
jgi:hypothetical protein